MDTGDKKKKQKPYSEYEKQLLMQLVQSKIDIVENRRTDGTTKKKSEAWEDITRQFNNSPNFSQTFANSLIAPKQVKLFVYRGNKKIYARPLKETL